MVLAALLALSQSSPLACPVMGVEAVGAMGRFDYGGIRLGVCCIGCREALQSDPAEVLKSARERPSIHGEFLFDPVTRMRIDLKKTPVSMDWKGVRYRFLTEANRDKFAASPKDFAEVPQREATYCWGEKAKKEGYAKAIGYGDHEGVRYYLYCPGCLASFRSSPSSFAEAAKGTVAENALYEAKDAIKLVSALPGENSRSNRG